MDLSNVSAIVTGAASGLGLATAREFSARGARVVGLDLDVSSAPSLEGVDYVAADVTSEDDVLNAVAIAARRGPLRVAVNCAGIGPSARILGRTGVHDLDLYRRVVQVNLIGTFTVMALAAEEISRTEQLDDGQRGVIVNTASIAAFEGQVGQVAYSSSKGGVVGMTLPAARDLSQVGIRVNTIAPGVVETPMLATVSEEYRAGLASGVPFPKRLARASEFAALAAFIVEHDYLNGEVIRMDGALRMAPR